MHSHKKEDAEIKQALDIVKSGIDRFFTEGFTIWSRETFQSALKLKIDINDPRIQSTLQEWEKMGVINYVGEDDSYFEVLKEFSE